MATKSIGRVRITTGEDGKQRIARVHRLVVGKRKNLEGKAKREAASWAARSKGKS